MSDSVSPVRADGGKRKRSISPTPRDRSPSPPTQRRRSNSPNPKVDAPASRDLPNLPHVVDIDPFRRRERQRQLAEQQLKDQIEPREAVVPKPEDPAKQLALMASTKSGGAYIPPGKMRALMEEAAKDKTSEGYQRLSWDALRKSINGLINKVNTANIKHIVPELFNENLIRGRGLFARSIMKAQSTSLPFTPVFAALIAIVNTKLPMVGELVLVRLISQFRRAFKRNDKVVCHATSTFIAHLCNQNVAHEIIPLQILFLLLEKPTDDSVEIAVGFMREVGAFLTENSPKGNNVVYERFRAVLHEGSIDKRIQYMIEVLFQVRKDKYKDNPMIPEGLDLVEEDEQITHRIALDDELQVQEGLNLFKINPKFLEDEDKYSEIKKEILGDEDDSDEESGSDVSDDEDDEDAAVAPETEGIQDMTETNLVTLRRTIYLTIMNSLNFQEAVHKLMGIQIPEGHEIELCNMVVECCSQERSYNSFYGLIGERFCKVNRLWTDLFQEAFAKYYETIHRYETNKLRNIGRFFGHLLASDGVSWAVLHCVHMNEEETTSSSRIFIKIVMQEMMEEMGVKKMAIRFQDKNLKEAFGGIFPMDNPKNTRFSINYFTSIGLGAITEDMRTYLQNAPKLIMAQRAAQLANQSDSDSDSSSSDSSDSDSSSSDSSSSDSESDSSDDRRRSRSRSPPRRRRSSPPSRRSEGRGGRKDSRSPTPVKRRYSDESRSPAPRDRAPPSNRRRYSDASDRSSPPRRRDDDTPPRRRDPSRQRNRSRDASGRDDRNGGDRDRYATKRR